MPWKQNGDSLELVWKPGARNHGIRETEDVDYAAAALVPEHADTQHRDRLGRWAPSVEARIRLSSAVCEQFIGLAEARQFIISRVCEVWDSRIAQPVREFRLLAPARGRAKRG